MSYFTDESGRLHVVDAEDNATPVFAKVSGGVLHCMVRCTDEATFDAVGLSVGLLTHENEGSAEVLDEEGNVVQEAVAPSGAIIPASGNTVTRIGPHVITPAVLDDEGNVVTPAVTDDRFHANFWLGSDVTARGNWEQWCIQWMAGADGTPNGSEESKVAQGVELIDPLSVATPHNVLL
jgi:hypothetical protein